jgi:hypothetical protein
MPKRQNEPLPDLSLDQLQQMMSAAGVKRLLLKYLAPNDNSKNQPYVSKGELQAFNILPAGEFYIDVSDKGRSIIKASFPLDWLQTDGRTLSAPNAKLIFYPQYPEVRLSGFLEGAKGAPNHLLNTREAGRLLFLGVTGDRRVVGWAAGPDSRLAKQISALTDLETEGVFRVVPLFGTEVDDDERMFAELRRIHELDWVDSKRMKSGVVVPYMSLNGIGYTLEAELGISNNGKAEPDIFGWEVKAAQSPNFSNIPRSKKMTLLTPEPDGGEYTGMSLGDFIRRFGYSDKRGRADRMNFGGSYRVGKKAQATGLTTILDGFDTKDLKITNPGGSLYVVHDDGTVVMSWSFPKLLSHWNKKHAKAVYVPGERRLVPSTFYRFGPKVFLGEGTGFELLLNSLAQGLAYYDPGIKLENMSSNPSTKPRSQFRIPWRHIADLYYKVRWHSLY